MGKIYIAKGTILAYHSVSRPFWGLGGKGIESEGSLLEMVESNDDYCKKLLVNLRKITRAIDLHSKDLKRKFGLTTPQLVILQEVANRGSISVTELAREISLSQATVTDIVNRLVKNGYLEKKRSARDKRRVTITPLPKCLDILEKAPPPLQEMFTNNFGRLKEWEQLMLLSALDRIVDMMSARKIEASPILTAGPLQAADEPAGLGGKKGSTEK